jgi:hypothetical protein
MTAIRQHDYTLDLCNNQLINLLLEKFTSETTVGAIQEARFGYHDVKKLPCFHNGFSLQFLVTEDYVQSLIGGLAWKDEAVVLSDSNIDVQLLSAGLVIDGVIMQDGDRVLLVNQTNLAENGAWVVGTQERAFDLDSSADFNNAIVPVKNGDVYKGAQFRCSTVDPDVDIDPIIFKDFTPSVPNSSLTTRGKIQLASQAEVLSGVDAEKAVTPATLKYILDPIRAQLGTLVPAPPSGLAGRTLLMLTYSAKEAGTGTVHTNCTDDTTPDGSATAFFDGDSGILSCEIDSVVLGSATLSTASDVGIYNSLHITDDSDPIPVGQMGHGIYKQLSAFIRVSEELSYAQHTYKLIHSVTGMSNLFTFNVDNPGITTISNVSAIYPAITKYISGVPTLKTGDSILVSFRVNGAVGKHYNATRLARISGLYTQSLDIQPPLVAPEENAFVDYSSLSVLVLSGVYTENASIDTVGYNSKGISGTVNILNTGNRVDTLSNESIRKEAGSGAAPLSGYGSTFDSTKSLKTFYIEELQLLGGKFQTPSGDFTSNNPAGPDYSSGMGTGVRRVLIDPQIILSDVSNLVITLSQVEGTWTDIETTGIDIQVKVEGQTGWLDANKAFSLVGFPENDGDPCMVYSDSTETQKKISFGQKPRSGSLFIRIGLPAGSDKKFSQSVTISNIN